MEKKDNKVKGLWKEFKAFINRGNVIDMAVGVVIGSAFGAIVTAVVNILLSVCTWAVPGGLKGLITVLPAASKAQEGITGIGQTFDASNLNAMVDAYGKSMGVADVEAQRVALTNSLKSVYTLHGTTYVYNQSAMIDWGAFINAVISFLIIALVLFIILKVFTTLQNKRKALEEKAREEYYEKHPEERPLPPVPGKPAPTETELLSQILATLKETKSKE